MTPDATPQRVVEPTIVLEQWNGTWTGDDPHANLKDDVVALRLLDPLETIEGLSRSSNVPVGALVRYVLAKWATGGSEGMLHTGGTTIERMHQACEAAETADSDEARLETYEQLRQIVSWLRAPFENPDFYDA
ncbi:MAG: hypothetical protein ACI8Y4_000432 [Candidatus Poriferisodalaceae bacterium]